MVACWPCDTNVSGKTDTAEPGGTRPAWYPPRGSECTWCVEWKSVGDNSELIDKAAAILRDEASPRWPR
jgi:hypothetical protein